jgi:hypothetical protein
MDGSSGMFTICVTSQNYPDQENCNSAIQETRKICTDVEAPNGEDESLMNDQ